MRSDDGEPIEDLVAIIHVEIESADRARPLRQTMFQYFSHLWQKYSEPILPVALYLRVGGDGIGVDSYSESFGDLEVVRYPHRGIVLKRDRHPRGSAKNPPFLGGWSGMRVPF